jgi:hypothetical protein
MGGRMMELAAADLITVLTHFLATYGPVVLIAYGVFMAVVLVLVVMVFITVLKGFWQHDKRINRRF